MRFFTKKVRGLKNRKTRKTQIHGDRTHALLGDFEHEYVHRRRPNPAPTLGFSGFSAFSGFLAFSGFSGFSVFHPPDKGVKNLTGV